MRIISATTLSIKKESGSMRLSSWHSLQILILLIGMMATVLPAVLVDLLHYLDIILDRLEFLFKETLLLPD